MFLAGFFYEIISPPLARESFAYLIQNANSTRKIRTLVEITFRINFRSIFTLILAKFKNMKKPYVLLIFAMLICFGCKKKCTEYNLGDLTYQNPLNI